MRHRSRRPVLDPLRGVVRRPRLALGIAALALGGTGAAIAAGAPHDRPVADPSPSGTTTAGAPTSTPTDRTGQPSRGDDRTAAPSTRSATPSPSAAASTDSADDAPTPGPRRSSPVRTRVQVHAPGASASVGTSPAPTPSAPVAAPDTTITTVSSTGSAAAFRLASSGTSTFQCSVDGASYSACGPVLTLTGLQPGWHTVSARAVGTDGSVDPTPASTRWHANGVTLP